MKLILLIASISIIFILKIPTSSADPIKLKLGQLNACEKFFMQCDEEQYKLSKKEDCDYFHEHRCQYYLHNANNLLYPMLFRQDIYKDTPFTQLVANKSLPSYRCISLKHFQKRFQIGNTTKEHTEQLFAIMPRKALPLEIFNHSKYVNIMKTDKDEFWNRHDRSEYSEFVYVHEDAVDCGDSKHMVVPLPYGRKKMMTSEFGEQITKGTYLKIIILFVLKDTEGKKCARIDPLHVKEEEKDLELLTYVVPAQVYPHAYRIYGKDHSKSPFTGHLRSQSSAWCRSNRFIMGLSNAILIDSGQQTQFVGAYYCSLYVNHQERIIRLTFTHQGEEYMVKVALIAVTSKTAWSPISIELNKKSGHSKIGSSVNLEVGRMESFEANDTYYSVEEQLVIGDEEMQLVIERLAINFCDDNMGLQFNNFATKYPPEDENVEDSSEKLDSPDYLETSMPGVTSLPGKPSRPDVTSMPGRPSKPGDDSGSCNCAPNEHTHQGDCNCAPASKEQTLNQQECNCDQNNPRDLLQSPNSCECTRILENW